MSFRVRHDSPHCGRTWHRRLAIERCEDRIALSATSDAPATPILFADGAFLSGGSFELFDASGRVVATAQFDKDSDSLVVDYTNKDWSNLDADDVRLSGGGFSQWLGDSWKRIPTPEEVPGSPGALVSLPIAEPGPQLPNAGAGASEPATIATTTLEQESPQRPTLESADPSDRPAALVQPQHDRSRNAAVFFEVAATTTTRSTETTAAQSSDPLQPRTSSSRVAHHASAIRSLELDAGGSSAASLSNHHTNSDQQADNLASSTPHDPRATSPTPSTVPATSNPVRLAEPLTTAESSNLSRHAAFAEWQLPGSSSALQTASRSYYPELLVVTIALLAATDRQLATRKSPTASSSELSSSRFEPRERPRGA